MRAAAMLRGLVLVAAFGAGLALAPRAASAYPQFQLSTGAQRCNQCHIAPAGGTLISGYGREEAADTISRGGDGGFLHGAWTPPDWLQLGGDLRGAFLVNDNGRTFGDDSSPAVHAFPMQADLYTHFKMGSQLSATIVLGYRGTARGQQAADVDPVGSREHYLMWRPKPQGPYVRAGRFLLPYGLRLAEHPSVVRRWGGQNVNEEPYALSGGVVKNEYEWHLSVHTADPVRCTGLGCADFGAAAYYERRMGEKFILGAQARIALYDEVVRGQDMTMTGGLVAKYWAEGAKLLFMAQADYGRKSIPMADYTNQEVLGYLGATWFPVKGIMITGAAETFIEDVGPPGVDRTAGSLEIQYFPKAHFELIGYGRVEADAWLYMTQLHYYL